MALTSFADVQKFFNDFIAEHGIQITGAPHGAFWETSYDDFVNGNVPGGSQTADPNTGQPLKILVIGHPEQSNIIFALAGTAGTFWDNNSGPNNQGYFGQMPYNGPYFSTDQINDLSDWIKNNCPE